MYCAVGSEMFLEVNVKLNNDDRALSVVAELFLLIVEDMTIWLFNNFPLHYQRMTKCYISQLVQEINCFAQP